MLPVRTIFLFFSAFELLIVFLSYKSMLDVFVVNGYMKFVQLMRQRSGFRSDLRSAAINEQFDTRDETRVIRFQKKRSLGNFIGLPHSAIGMVDTIRAIASAGCPS
jgi:hypothetical protein